MRCAHLRHWCKWMEKDTEFMKPKKIEGQSDLPFVDEGFVLSAEFRRLYANRMEKKKSIKQSKRKTLKKDERLAILKKTNFRCHICGEKVSDENVHIDHVSPQSIGGEDEGGNYLAACSFCNGYRWNYLPEEIKWILKVGVWAKTQVEFETDCGRVIADSFVEYEKGREERRLNPREPLAMEPSKYPVRKIVDYAKLQRRGG